MVKHSFFLKTMSSNLRSYTTFRVTIYLIITFCWFETFLQKCTFARSYQNRILFDTKSFPTNNKENHLASRENSNTWQPRKHYSKKDSEHFFQYQNILIDETFPAQRNHRSAKFLPQLNPNENENSWEMYGDCKVNQVFFRL